MIKLTRISGRPFVLNADRILFIEETPDTIITLDTKEKVLVKDPMDEVIAKVIDFQKSIRTFSAFGA